MSRFGRFAVSMLFVAFIMHMMLVSAFWGSSDKEKKEEDTHAPAAEAEQGGSGARFGKGHDQLDDIPPQFFMKTSYKFPDHPFLRFTSGEESKVLVGLHQLWTKPVYVFGLSGALFVPDFSKVYRNLTQQKTYSLVRPNEQASFLFKFRPEMEASEFGLAIYIDFTDEKQSTWNRVVAFNGTIEIVDPVESLLDAQSLFLYVLGVLFVMGGVLLVQKAFFVKGKTSKRGSRSSASSSSYLSVKTAKNDSNASLVSSSPSPATDRERSPFSSSPSISSEWIPDAHFQLGGNPERRSPKLRTKKN